MVFTQNFNPTSNLLLSAVLAMLPLLAVLVLLGVFRWKAHWAGLAGLIVGLVVAIAAYGMGIGPALNSGLFGAATAVLVILWITFNAIWIYNLTVKTGHFAVLRRSFTSISDDRRIQAIVIAFSFGALIEALAGGGSPVAICAVMLIAIGFDPLKAAAIALIANTAPVAFGGMGNPITVLGTVTSTMPDPYGAMAGRQTAFIALFVPFILLLLADGKRGLRQAWPAALVAGVTFAASQLIFSTLNYRLCDIGAALVSAGALIAFGKVWRPSESPASPPASAAPTIAGGSVDDPAFVRKNGRPGGDTRADVIAAFAPYVIIIVLFSIAQIEPFKTWLAKGTATFAWPGLSIAGPTGKHVATDYVLNYLSAPGSLLFVSGLLTLLVLRVSLVQGIKTYGETLRQFGWAILTILCVFALAYVMRLSGQISTLGLFLAQAGAAFAFLAPVVGWFGVAITGTDAGSNALFAGLQVTAADNLGVSPLLFGAANSSGGVMAKMISPQSLAIGAAAVGAVGAEGDLFRRVIGWSVLLLLALCVLVFLQSTSILGWMIP
jgi:lactate permease